jgi:predicted RNA-binding Zn ribbon-like protein
MDTEVNTESELPTLDFLFIGGNLAINLVNTWRNRPIPGSRQNVHRLDLLWDISRAELWWRKACVQHGLIRYEEFGWSEESFEILLALRAELRSLFEGIIAKHTELPQTPCLNRVLARGSFFVGTEGTHVSREYVSRNGRPDALLAIGLAAAELLAEGDLSRLHDCQSDRCLALFYDSTKSGTRHWCRPECMNRARARENYWRSKEREQTPPSE